MELKVVCGNRIAHCTRLLEAVLKAREFIKEARFGLTANVIDHDLGVVLAVVTDDDTNGVEVHRLRPNAWVDAGLAAEWDTVGAYTR